MIWQIMALTSLLITGGLVGLFSFGSSDNTNILPNQNDQPASTESVIDPRISADDEGYQADSPGAYYELSKEDDDDYSDSGSDEVDETETELHSDDKYEDNDYPLEDGVSSASVVPTIAESTTIVDSESTILDQNNSTDKVIETTANVQPGNISNADHPANSSEDGVSSASFVPTIAQSTTIVDSESIILDQNKSADKVIETTANVEPANISNADHPANSSEDGVSSASIVSKIAENANKVESESINLTQNNDTVKVIETTTKVQPAINTVANYVTNSSQDGASSTSVDPANAENATIVRTDSVNLTQGNGTDEVNETITNGPAPIRSSKE